MVTHSSILAWRILRTEEPGRLQSLGSQSWTRLSTVLQGPANDQGEAVSAFVCEHSISSDPKVGLPGGASGKKIQL